MLYKYKKDYQKIAMGLLSFIAELKDISRLQSELKWYDAEDNRNLYLWKDDSNDFVGIVGIEENDDIINEIENKIYNLEEFYKTDINKVEDIKKLKKIIK